MIGTVYLDLDLDRLPSFSPQAFRLLQFAFCSYSIFLRIVCKQRLYSNYALQHASVSICYSFSYPFTKSCFTTCLFLTPGITPQKYRELTALQVMGTPQKYVTRLKMATMPSEGGITSFASPYFQDMMSTGVLASHISTYFSNISKCGGPG